MFIRLTQVLNFSSNIFGLITPLELKRIQMICKFRMRLGKKLKSNILLFSLWKSIRQNKDNIFSFLAHMKFLLLTIIIVLNMHVSNCMEIIAFD